MSTDTFPWGERRPPNGYRVGDKVGIIHSDHESYMFDNPEGTVVRVKPEDDSGPDLLWVDVRVCVSDPERLYLIDRPN